MKVRWSIVALMLLTEQIWAEESTFPDLSGFTQSTTEHILNRIDSPFQVRAVEGIIEIEGNSEPLPSVILEIKGPGSERTIRRTQSDRHGRFKIRHVPRGTYRFKATLNGFQSVIGTIVVSKTNIDRIKLKMLLGV